jgi:membrane-associated protein
VIASFTQTLIDLLSTPWSYLIVLGIAALDAVLPFFPSETIAITGGVLASLGHLSLAVVIVSAAIGAFLGDSTAYALGRWVGTAARDRLFRGERSKRALVWAERQLRERGWYFILVARFIPGGRTVTTFTAGFVRYLPAIFFPADAVAAAAWASYAVLLGYFGGQVFGNRPFLALVVALGIAGVVTVLVEVTRRLRARRR